jgi:hypothetical protein
MILAVVNIKGGVGKSTLAVNIAIALQQDGRDVLVIDSDEQASTATFGQLRAEVPGAGPTIVQLQGAAIRQQVRSLAEKYPKIIIDVGGRDTGSLRAALTVADAILIPFQRAAVPWPGPRRRHLPRRNARPRCEPDNADVAAAPQSAALRSLRAAPAAAAPDLQTALPNIATAAAPICAETQRLIDAAPPTPREPIAHTTIARRSSVIPRKPASEQG